MTDELKAKIETIRELAGKATPSEWQDDECYTKIVRLRDWECVAIIPEPQGFSDYINEVNVEATCKYIVATQPQTMLEILAYIDQLEKEYAVKQDTIDQQSGIIAKLIKEFDWLAEFAVGGECPPEYEYARAGGAVVRCHHDCKECWKEAAEDAVDGVE